MHRKPLLDLLSKYQSTMPSDCGILDSFQRFVNENSRCFERSLEIGHVTGSSWIVDVEKKHALFTYHAKLNKWLQLGGHADGMSDVLAVALKEAEEESGLQNLVCLSTQIYDLDIHLVPDKKGAHYHYDVRFIFEADRSAPLKISNESKDLAWIALDAIEERTKEPSVLRMAQKMKQMFSF